MTKKKMFGVSFGALAAGAAVAYYLYTRSGGGITPRASCDQLFGVNPTSAHSRKQSRALSGLQSHGWGRNELTDQYATAADRAVTLARMRNGALVDMNPSSEMVKVEESSLPHDLPDQTDDSAAAIGSVFVKTRASMGRLLS